MWSLWACLNVNYDLKFPVKRMVLQISECLGRYERSSKSKYSSV